ncbi:uncharacterized protein LOC143855424 [Tasmannia lanceolata]|uniref:uncharacterized protein LOC143855424 n=1 Tax=Tasmannia lanceolata TaxID=3420 RepID=UPI0040643642
MTVKVEIHKGNNQEEGQPLLLYLSITDTATGSMLAQQDPESKREKFIYYINKKMLEFEMKYTILEKTCLALVWVTKRLRQWLLLLSEFEITYVTQKSIKGQVIAEQLADSPVEDNAFLKSNFPDEEIIDVEEGTSNKKWLMYFDGGVNNQGQGVGAVLVSPWKEYIPISIKLQFKCMNNMAEYEAFIAGLEAALVLHVQDPDVFEDSILIICQINGRSPASRRFQWAPAHVNAIEIAARCPVGKPRYTDIKNLISAKGHPPEASGKERRTLQRLGSNFIICELHSLTSPWPFSVWGIDIIGKIYPRSSSGHEYILVAIDYFIKWIEATTYASLASASVVKFIRTNIICRYGLQHELISDNGSHFKKEVVHLCEEFKIKHHKSSPYRPQTNGAVEVSNKNIEVIISKMAETYKDYSNKLLYALWAYTTSIRSSIGLTPYSLVYGMEAVLPVELRIPSLRRVLRSFPEVGA